MVHTRKFAAVALGACLVSAGCDDEAGSGSDTEVAATDGGSGSGDSQASASGGSNSGGSNSGGSNSGGSDSGGGSDTAASTTGDPSDDPHQACVDRINMFRATLDLPPYERWTAAEDCTDNQAADDAAAGGLHPNFGACDEFAQNTCPGWPSMDAVLSDCLQLMWDEGPGEDFNAHGHFLNMSSTQYSRVACGFSKGQGGVWSNQNFQ